MATDNQQPDALETTEPTSPKVRWRMEALGRLGPGIAHEINTPMQYIGDNTHFLEEAFTDLKNIYEKFQSLLSSGRTGRVPEQLIADIDALITQMDLEYILGEVPSAFRQTHEGLEKIQRMVRGIQHFSQENASQKTSQEFSAIVENVVNLSRNVWKYQSDLRIELANNLPGFDNHPEDISLALLYLIDYSIRCINQKIDPQSGQKGTIVIAAERKSDLLEVRVSHNGAPPNVSLADLLNTTTDPSREPGGRHAPLMLCHYIVTRDLGGQFMWETETGSGTSFVISLPTATDKHDDNQGDMFIG